MNSETRPLHLLDPFHSRNHVPLDLKCGGARPRDDPPGGVQQRWAYSLHGEDTRPRVAVDGKP
eukprot:3904505-Pyramimonas_sp.AAC.1